MSDLGVLVVDDDSMILSVIERMFGLFDINVDCVPSSAEALERLKTKAYKTMITDMDMPGLNGLELAGRAREVNPALHILLFTGNHSARVLALAIDPKVSNIAEVHLKPRGLHDMVTGIVRRETGKGIF